MAHIDYGVLGISFIAPMMSFLKGKITGRCRYICWHYIAVCIFSNMVRDDSDESNYIFIKILAFVSTSCCLDWFFLKTYLPFVAVLPDVVQT